MEDHPSSAVGCCLFNIFSAKELNNENQMAGSNIERPAVNVISVTANKSRTVKT
jgi:hypothetical protein